MIRKYIIRCNESFSFSNSLNFLGVVFFPLTWQLVVYETRKDEKVNFIFITVWTDFERIILQTLKCFGQNCRVAGQEMHSPVQ